MTDINAALKIINRLNGSTGPWFPGRCAPRTEEHVSEVDGNLGDLMEDLLVGTDWADRIAREMRAAGVIVDTWVHFGSVCDETLYSFTVDRSRPVGALGVVSANGKARLDKTVAAALTAAQAGTPLAELIAPEVIAAMSPRQVKWATKLVG